MLFYENIAQVVSYMALGAYVHSEGDQINATERCAEALFSLNYVAEDLVAAVIGNSRAYTLAKTECELYGWDLDDLGEEQEQVFATSILWHLADIEVDRIHKEKTQ